MDWSSFASVAVAGVPLLFVVIGVVEWFKRLGIKDNPLLLVSMAWGLVIGGGYMLTKGIPDAFAGWFAVVIYGLAMGLVASGLYDTVKTLAEKIITGVKPQ
jgi:hypothetical protein